MNTYRLAPLCLLLGSAILVSGMLGCGGGDETGAYAVTDSAGVEIVMNSGPVWSEGKGWTVEVEPSLTIGTMAGDPAYELYRVSGARRLPDGGIVVLNSGTQELRFYDEGGNHRLNAGGEGEGPGYFQMPYGLFAPTSDTIMVWDVRQRRMSVFNVLGDYIRSFMLPTGEGMYFITAMFGDRALLATSGVRESVTPQSGPVRGKNLLTVFDLEGDSVASLGEFSDREGYGLYDDQGVRSAGRLFGRTTVMAAHGAHAFIGTNDGYVIDQYERGGRLIRSIRVDAVEPVTDEMFAAELEATLESLDGPYGDMMRPLFEDMSKPEVIPSYYAAMTDTEGNLWLRHYHCRSMPSFEWTVFDPQGRVLGDVTLPERFDVYEIGIDYVLGRWRDEADVEYVRMYRLAK